MGFPSMSEAVEIVREKYAWAEDFTIESKFSHDFYIVVYFSFNDNVTEYWYSARFRKRSDGSYNPESEQCVKWWKDACVDMETGEIIS